METISGVLQWSINHELGMWGIAYCFVFIFGFALSRWRVVWGIITGLGVLIWMVFSSDQYWKLAWLVMVVSVICILHYFCFYNPKLRYSHYHDIYKTKEEAECEAEQLRKYNGWKVKVIENREGFEVWIK